MRPVRLWTFCTFVIDSSCFTCGIVQSGDGGTFIGQSCRPLCPGDAAKHFDGPQAVTEYRIAHGEGELVILRKITFGHHGSGWRDHQRRSVVGELNCYDESDKVRWIRTEKSRPVRTVRRLVLSRKARPPDLRAGNWLPALPRGAGLAAWFRASQLARCRRRPRLRGTHR